MTCLSGANNAKIIRLRHEGQGRKQSMHHQERTVFGTPKKSSHNAGPSPGNDYYVIDVSIPCFFDRTVKYNFDGSVRRDGQVTYTYKTGDPKIAAGDVITLDIADRNTFKVTGLEEDEGVFGGASTIALDLVRTHERN